MEFKYILLGLSIIWIVVSVYWFYIRKSKAISVTSTSDVIAYRPPVQVNLVIGTDDTDFDTSIFSTYSFTMKELEELMKSRNEIKEEVNQVDPTLTAMMKMTAATNEDGEVVDEDNETEVEHEVGSSEEESTGIPMEAWDDNDMSDSYDDKVDQENKDDATRNEVHAENEYHDFLDEFNK